MNITLNNSNLDNFVLLNQEYLVNKDYYDLKSGLQEYRLYSYLSTFFNNSTILDIGTLDGRSAVALSHNMSNKVLSYNIIDQINNNRHRIYSKSNIEFRIKNVMDDLNEDFISNIRAILIDIDHFYTVEKLIIDRLRELKFNGIIILDDIHHPSKREYECMQRLWNGINDRKLDVTKYAHHSGTGIILMCSDIEFTLE